jgi:hypothetical protein
MADNIRIIGNINDIQRVNRLKLEDLNLLNLQVKNQTFGFENDYIEYFVYDGGGNLINSNYNYRDFKLPSDSYLTPGSKLPIIEIDPTTDLQSLGYISGQFKTQYNFQTKKVSSSDADLFISEISNNRTEIGIKSNIISSEDLIRYGNNLINELENSLEQKYFILNLSNNTQVLIVNVAIKIEDSSILLKLYEPLSQNIFEKETGWITEEIIEPYVFDINLDTSVIPSDSPILRGPNFDINVDIKQNVNTNYQNYSSLVSSLTGSSYQQVLNYMNSDSYDLNIDYTTFSNFIHFSSAKKRLNIFYDKVKQIENYNNNINIIANSTNILKNEQTASIKIQIDNLTQNFDGFENYMYFESSSYAWPKSNSNKPYSLLSTGSIQTWYNNYTSSAENYDEDNLDRLYNILPNYIKNDPNNYQNYYDFIDMIGHYFDNIWIYISSINELYNADNNLEKGVSKDIVYDALQSLGVKLYNSKGDDNFNDYISGLNSGSTLFTDDFSVTSSYLNNIPKKDLLAETYKRIYHNIPLLSKTRGTTTGLQNLITTFGISSSILSPKEFGGSTKKNKIKGFDNDKITIQNNSITGSVLSPFISLQTSPTASTEFTSTDLHFIDLSFSPQNELNTRLSASIANLNPTFSLDEYIGDPGLMASSSYQSLIQQNNYFISASSAVSGSEKPLDYKGFIELVKYFDNSLFKMLKDFVPARTNALTGITIKSSVLERNKIPVYQPKVTEEIIYDAEYNAPIISEDKDYYYNELEGNKSSFYTGQITGSYVNVYSYFDDEHINPYLHPTESIDINKFNHTDFNITLNNVSSSIISSVRKKVEPLYTTINNIVFNTSSTEYEYISSAELQDSNLNLQGHKNSRYEGTKLSSLRLNSYSSASAVYDGDISYGKDPVINHNTRKLGLFTQIQQNLFLPYPQQNNVFLKYLVDENGNLTELNKKNKNWEEVQNIFKSGDILTVSQFDNSKNSDTSNASQKFTDGEKLIYNSGYSYSPILYNSNDNELYFNYTGDTLSKQFQIRLKGGFISGSTPGTETYPIVNGKIFKAVDKAINDPDNVLYRDGNAYYNNLGNNTFSTYSIQENGFQKFNFNFSIQVQFQSTNQSGSFYAAIKEVEGPTLITQSIFVASGIRTTENTGLQYAKKIGIPYDFSNVAVYNNAGTLIETFPPNTTLVSISAGNVLDSSCNIIDAESGNDYYITEYDESILPSFPNCSDIFQIPNSTKLYTFPVSNLISTLDFTLDSDYKSFNSGQKIAFELTTGSVAFTTNNFTASIIPYDNANNGVIRSQMQINQIGVNPFAINDNGNKPFISGSLMGSNSIILNSSLTGFKDYLFLPSGSGFPKNKLYDKYSDALYTFSPKKGDLIILYYGPSNSLYQSEISDVNILNRKLTFQLNSDLPSILNKPVYSNSDISQFIFLTKVKDETNVLLQFDKKGGETSIGFIIPNNIHPDVLDNIDTITKEVKQKLIDYGVTNPNF